MDFTLTVQQGDMPPLRKRFILPALAMIPVSPLHQRLVRDARRREERRIRDLYLAQCLGELERVPPELTLEQASAMMGTS
jgi:hypothetical protein